MEGESQNNTERTPKQRGMLIAPWKPGQSGNPKGRPKGSKSIKTILKEILKSKAPASVADAIQQVYDTESEELTVAEAVAYRIIASALKGEPWAIEHVAGKPDQHIDHGSADGSMVPAPVIVTADQAGIDLFNKLSNGERKEPPDTAVDEADDDLGEEQPSVS